MERKEYVIRVGGKEYKVLTPFSFRFYQWLFNEILPEKIEAADDVMDVATHNIYSKFNEIQSKLTGVPLEEIEEKQTVDELEESIQRFIEQFAEEAKSIPFTKALLLVTRSRVRMSQVPLERPLDRADEIKMTGSGG
ncbi:MAG: hypothetical protein ABIK73_06735 [candidate division WOR-3 bacterium]